MKRVIRADIDMSKYRVDEEKWNSNPHRSGYAKEPVGKRKLSEYDTQLLMFMTDPKEIQEVMAELESMNDWFSMTYLLGNPNCPTQLLAKYAKGGSGATDFQPTIANNPDCPQNVLRYIAENPNDPNNLFYVIRNENCPVDIIESHVDDENRFVSDIARERLGLDVEPGPLKLRYDPYDEFDEILEELDVHADSSARGGVGDRDYYDYNNHREAHVDIDEDEAALYEISEIASKKSRLAKYRKYIKNLPWEPMPVYDEE